MSHCPENFSFFNVQKFWIWISSPSCLSNRTTVLRSSSDPDSSSSVLPISSDSSLTQTSVANRRNLKCQIPFDQWLRRKEVELRRRQEQERAEEQRKRELEEKEAERLREKKLQDEQNFQAWLRRKKKLDTVENEMFKNDINIQKQLVKANEKAKEAGKICVWKWKNQKAEQRKGRNLRLDIFYQHVSKKEFCSRGTWETVEAEAVGGAKTQEVWGESGCL